MRGLAKAHPTAQLIVGLAGGGLTAVEVSDLAGDPGLHWDSSAGVLDGQ
jgi:hypothetical protein